MGYAHVIENEADFPLHFGSSVMAGVLGLDATVYMHPKRRGEEAEREKVKGFLQKWQKYDWTVELDGGEYLGESGQKMERETEGENANLSGSEMVREKENEG